ncbi:beta-lactamase hydrolase domain-containing protein [Vibrio maerlii]|uniref:beta-lactamase hydrolase domain-containing protein n=1 Tax=Vibrio maerlii TaxID=2231648 RepID=UPI000E3D0C17|nr:sulfur transferase domain-containing protein [Vibrio maerlii]
MNIQTLSTHYSVSDQLFVEDLSTIKKLGYEAVVCNRPDDEVEDQPSFNSLRERAEELDMKMFYIPMSCPEFSMADQDELRNVLNEYTLVLGYCRTGNRSKILWDSIAALSVK